MALAPGETNEAFIREVDENLRRSQAEEFFRRWGVWLIGAGLLFLLAVGGYLYWNNQQRAKAADQSEKLSAVLTDIGAGNDANVDQRLAEIQSQGTDEYAGLARLTGAAVALQKGDRNKAIQAYREVASDSGQPQAIRDTAVLRGTALQFDSLKPEEVIQRLEPLAKPESGFYGSAAELTALAMLKQNRRAEAGRLFAAVAANQEVPGSLRSRAMQIAGSLGVDATGAVPDAE